MAEIGIKIMARRKELNMTQEELAKKMGYKSKSTINKIENGTNDIPQSKIVKFAEVLETSIAYLMGWEEELESKSDEQVEESANRLADLFLRIEIKEDDTDLMVMLEEYMELPDTKKAQVREYVHLLAGKD